MCLELIEYITLDAYVEGQPREIYIYYKLLDEPLKDKRSLFKGVFTLFTQHMKVCYYLARRQRFLSTVICFRSIRSKLAMLLQTLWSSIAAHNSKKSEVGASDLHTYFAEKYFDFATFLSNAIVVILSRFRW